MIKKLYEYELTWTFSEDGEETIIPQKYYFTEKVAKDHNKQYLINDVPRKLVKVKGSEVVKVPTWWSGNIAKFKKNHKS